MKKLIYIALFLIIILWDMPIKTFADVLPNGEKSVGYCFKIDNITAYPDYTFIAYPTSWNNSYTIIKENICLDFYKNVTPIIYAIRSRKFHEKDIVIEGSKIYFSRNINALPSGIAIHSYPSLDKNNPLERVVDIATITSITQTTFVLKKSTIVYLYTDGTTEEKKYASQNNIPQPSKKVFVPGWISDAWYLIIPIITLGIFLLTHKRQQKK